MNGSSRCRVILTALVLACGSAACAALFDARASVPGGNASGGAANANTPATGGTTGDTTGGTTGGSTDNANTTPAPATNQNVATNMNTTPATSAAVTYTNTTSALIKTYCLGCHAPTASTPQAPYMTTYDDAVSGFKNGGGRADVANGSMPMGTSLTAAQKASFNAWAVGGYAM